MDSKMKEFELYTVSIQVKVQIPGSTEAEYRYVSFNLRAASVDDAAERFEGILRDSL